MVIAQSRMHAASIKSMSILESNCINRQPTTSDFLNNITKIPSTTQPRLNMVNFLHILALLAALTQTPLAALQSTPTSSAVSTASAIPTASTMPTDPISSQAIVEKIAVLQICHHNLSQRLEQARQGHDECDEDQQTLWKSWKSINTDNRNCDLTFYYYKRWESAEVAWLDVYKQCKGLGELVKELEKKKEEVGKELEELKGGK